MHEYMSKVGVWELRCPGLPEDVSRARRLVRDVLDGSPHADDAALIVTELTANAIEHTTSAHSGFRVALTCCPDRTVISVADAGGASTTPRVRCPGSESLNGRGLALVTAFAISVRVDGDDHGRTVTAELHADEPC